MKLTISLSLVWGVPQLFLINGYKILFWCFSATILHNVSVSIHAFLKVVLPNSFDILVQDAHEFLSQVLDQCKEEVIELNKTHVDALPTECELGDKSPTINEYLNPTQLNFEMEVVHTITCCK